MFWVAGFKSKVDQGRKGLRDERTEDWVFLKNQERRKRSVVLR